MNSPPATDNDQRETRWSLVLRACAGSREALEDLSDSYWPVIYAFLRRKGFDPDDAQDMTQETFARLFKDGFLPAVDPAKGRFRSFLFACAEHEASHFRERNSTQKRGANQVFSWDVASAEESCNLLPATAPPDERAFDRAWSKLIVSRALTKMASEYDRLGKTDVFKTLLPLLNAGTERGDQRILAEKLGLSEVNARVSWLRFKSSFITHLRREVVETVAIPSEVDAELRHLMHAWLSAENAV